ncbi:hypothetical protein [Nocardia jinanensis]|uniref:hypothetical protein n=1 Tax=Nocardia jinanensis TaxID=382504 RepID=UPI000B22DDEC|nr:hypothetical protein [Nocardia jinanensis]
MSSNKNLVNEYYTAIWSNNYEPDTIRELTTHDLLWRYPMHGEPQSLLQRSPRRQVRRGATWPNRASCIG